MCCCNFCSENVKVDITDRFRLLVMSITKHVVEQSWALELCYYGSTISTNILCIWLIPPRVTLNI